MEKYTIVSLPSALKKRKVLQIVSGLFGEKNLKKFKKNFAEILKALTFATPIEKRGGEESRKIFESLEITVRKLIIYGKV